MISAAHECVAHLASELGDRVHRPGTPGYRASLGRVFFPDASRRRPPCVVHPRSVADVSSAMKIARAHAARVTVRGGGLSSNCVADDAVMLDLSVHLTSARPHGATVSVDGGATVETTLGALAPAHRVVPAGVVGPAGFGLITRGGVGYLTRSMGLTLDHLVELELVLPSGEMVRLSEASSGEEAELWWAARGCAPCFGVVTSAVLGTREQGPMFVDRLVVGLDALPTYFALTPELPRHTAMSAVLGYAPDSTDTPVLFVYTACASRADEDVAGARSATSAVAAASAAAPGYRAQGRGRYLSGLPAFAIPASNGTEPEPIRLPAPALEGDVGNQFFGKSVFVGPTLGADAAAGLAELIRNAPTPACRIDFQHTGGALADTADSATAFCGRSAEWNVATNAVWSDEAHGQACRRWARDVVAVLAADSVGVYSVEIRPGFDETERELALAFGDNLARLRALRLQVDPAGVFGSYPL